MQSDEPVKRLSYGENHLWCSFIANKCVQQNAIDFELQYPHAAAQVGKLVYVDDYLRGANSVQEAAELQCEIHHLF